MSRKGHGGLCKAPKKEERKSERPREERDLIKFITPRFERRQVLGLSELCLGKAMVAYKKPQQRKKEKSKRLREEGVQIKFIDLRFEGWQVVGFGKARRRLEFRKLLVLWMNDELGVMFVD